MRRIEIPYEILDGWRKGRYPGKGVVFPVRVDWKELRLTSRQRAANTKAIMAGRRPPHHDNRIFEVLLPVFQGEPQKRKRR